MALHDKWYIMNAACLFDGKSATLEDIKKVWGNGTVIAVTRGKTKMFVCGAQGDYEVKIGEQVNYCIDTGMGTRNTADLLTVENVINYNESCTSKVNDVGMNEKRRVWVFK